MIRLDLTFETVNDMHRELAAILAGNAAASPMTAFEAATVTEEPKPKATRGKSKTAEPASEATAEPTAASTSGGSGETSTTSTTATAAASPSDGPVTKEIVAPLASKYAEKAGVPMLQAVFQEFGSANGKFSGVTEDKYPAMKARLEDLLAG